MRAAPFALAALLALMTPALAQEKPAREPVLQSRIDAALAAMPGSYVPRTRHIGPNGPLYTNRLILEASPYLRQHAHNPVDWRPWGAEALAEAAARNVPVFLSLGYATCHWCHVMEEESFDDVAVGEMLNRDYVAVKVDREELPDIDAQYMYATLALTGRGGWPNNLVLTPRGEPFGAFSYTPREQFINVMANVTTAWRDPVKRPEVEAFAADVAAVVRDEASRTAAARTLDDGDFRRAGETLAGAADPFLGGWGETQKFPNEVMIRFVLDQAQRTGDAGMREAALHALRAIAAGGIHDHAGGGFHRYTVDPEWRTPHFEKMLYNQALIAPLMVEGWRMSGDARLRRAAVRALDYVLRDMTAPQGAFYSAEDADSLYHGEMEEGAFYVWTPDQLTAALGADAEYANNTLGLFKTATVPAGSVAHLDPDATPDFARLDAALERLRRAREARPHPLVDTKIITGWNGLMIRALAQGGAAMGTARHIEAAARAGDFLWSAARRGEGLSRVWAEGAASGAGRLADYAWLGLGYVALHDATGEARWLDRAAALAAQIGPRFGGEGQNGKFRMAEQPGPLGARLDMEDGATPSGNASALELFALLAQRSDDPAHRARADALLAGMSGLLAERPTAHPEGLTAAQIHLYGQAGAERSLAAGKLRVRARREGAGLALTLDFAPGWHANADRVRQEWLVPTALEGPGLAGVRYPSARTVRLGFSDEPLDVIDGRVEIAAAQVGEVAELHVQVCSDETCLLPETATFRPGAAW